MADQTTYYKTIGSVLWGISFVLFIVSSNILSGVGSGPVSDYGISVLGNSLLLGMIAFIFGISRTMFYLKESRISIDQ